MSKRMNIQYVRGKQTLGGATKLLNEQSLVSYLFSNMNNTLENLVLLIVLSLTGKVAWNL